MGTDPQTPPADPQETPQSAQIDEAVAKAVAKIFASQDAADASQGDQTDARADSTKTDGKSSGPGESFEAMVERVITQREAARKGEDRVTTLEAEIKAVKEEMAKLAKAGKRSVFSALGRF